LRIIQLCVLYSNFYGTLEWAIRMGYYCEIIGGMLNCFKLCALNREGADIEGVLCYTSVNWCCLQVFDQLRLTAYDLSVDMLDVHAVSTLLLVLILLLSILTILS